MSNSPKVSIIIPVYNTEEYLEKCLDSVKKQSLQNIEIICVDDASTDSSKSIIEKYCKENEKFKLLRHPKNVGLHSAWRTGVINASGEYVMFLDSDDDIDENLCECAYELIKKNKTDFLEFSFKKINIENKIETIIDPPENLDKEDNILSLFFVTQKAYPALWLKIYKRELIRKAFLSIPEIPYYIPGSDLLTTFFTAYYAKSFTGEKTVCKYNYYYGRGISSGIQMPLSKFKKYCGMCIYPKIVDDFLHSQNANRSEMEAAKYFSMMLIRNTLKYFHIISENEKREAQKLFIESWGNSPYFLDTFYYEMERIQNNSDRTINMIYNSKSWKIGNTIVGPIHKAKEIITDVFINHQK